MFWFEAIQRLCLATVSPASPNSLSRLSDRSIYRDLRQEGALSNRVVSERLDLSFRGVVFSRTSPTRSQRGFLNGSGRHRPPSCVTEARTDLSYERDRNLCSSEVTLSPVPDLTYLITLHHPRPIGNREGALNQADRLRNLAVHLSDKSQTPERPLPGRARHRASQPGAGCDL